MLGSTGCGGTPAVGRQSVKATGVKRWAIIHSVSAVSSVFVFMMLTFCLSEYPKVNGILPRVTRQYLTKVSGSADWGI